MASKRTSTAYEDRDVVVLAGARGQRAGGGGAGRAAGREGQGENVVLGRAHKKGRAPLSPPRHIGLKLGAPIETPALTVNRLCGSGLQAIVSAAQSLLLGEGRIALVGGGENMTQAPFVIRGARAGLNLGEHKLEDYLWESLVDSYCG